MRMFEPKAGPLRDWHPWFAWKPVRIRAGDGVPGPVVWLEWIERKRDGGCGSFESYWWFWYRFPEG